MWPFPGSTPKVEYARVRFFSRLISQLEEIAMSWKKPIVREVQCGMEINMYGPGEDDERDYDPDRRYKK